ncbi:MAG: excinuclease ABC subunit C, partial [Nitrospirae bacterium]|nr:excinuclease ABC subunit C [Nitrospirota bacterium]
RGKEAMLSGLDNIKGIGRGRKLALLKYFGSIEALKAASIEDLLKAPRMTKTVAETLYQGLRKVSSPLMGEG